jgi:hypothetical protein
MRDYLVIGIYLDDETRYADTYHAESAEAAEAEAIAQCPGLTVVATIVGNLDDVKVSS